MSDRKKFRAGVAAPFALLLVVIGLAALPFVGAAQQPSPPKLTQELPPGPMQAKATTSCTECHEARIIVQQRLSKVAWTKEVDKMIKWGAVVDGKDRDALIDYLSTNFNPDQPQYEPSRTSAEKEHAAKTTGKSNTAGKAN